MREIKFRAWWPNVKKMRYFENPEIVYDGIQWGMFLPTVEKNVYLGEAKTMQFTGLRDKNGREIYEGDMCELVRFKGDCLVRGKIYFENGSFQIENGSAIGISGNMLGQFNQTIIEIIGNIHENPELLQEGEI